MGKKMEKNNESYYRLIRLVCSGMVDSGGNTCTPVENLKFNEEDIKIFNEAIDYINEHSDEIDIDYLWDEMVDHWADVSDYDDPVNSAYYHIENNRTEYYNLVP